MVLLLTSEMTYCYIVHHRATKFVIYQEETRHSNTCRASTVWSNSQYLKCLLHVDSCHNTTSVTSECTIVMSGHHDSIRRMFISNNGTIWQTIVLHRKLATGSIHDYLFGCCWVLDWSFYEITGVWFCGVPLIFTERYSVVSVLLKFLL